ncbi:type IV secretion system protein [Campylobacter hyointestinalis]|uniref:type IV secretion system protein n=1 Tax=Campylobacter hyointestinalis TaxID=198 RepID=UPI000DCEA695|nr:type IV secretion system protein [Campylobacter hyointestinalis]HDX6248670.1 type IV secretion system protein [Campylobacter fetus subsp. venerealis]RAZ23972.1 virulence protein [Campylobacter hyointestinalis subsp. lawsonii]RAZ38389.1 virulence protein [Campylobacter hyointestinalis subsp. lawsonii]RAZ46165.1 virulence protein [Campylobacter hyointestinalis subsp. lawsonii]HDX6254622.1 type IV secretion system protein [Campylobacter fetus subsp. venerealis]
MALEDKKLDPNFIFQAERNIKAYMLYVILTLAVVSISLSVAIALLTPLKETKPVLLKFSDGDSRFVTIDDTDLNVRNSEELLKSILAGYVKNRELINRIDDAERYNEIRTQSSRQVWEDFQNLVSDPNSIYATKNYYRDIKIINVAILSQNVATIDFQAEITNPTRTEVTYKKYRSAIEYDFRKQSNTYADIMKNPTGFIVDKYRVTQILDEKGEQ